jgi:hypothetical protein
VLPTARRQGVRTSKRSKQARDQRPGNCCSVGKRWGWGHWVLRRAVRSWRQCGAEGRGSLLRRVKRQFLFSAWSSCWIFRPRRLAAPQAQAAARSELGAEECTGWPSFQVSRPWSWSAGAGDRVLRWRCGMVQIREANAAVGVVTGARAHIPPELLRRTALLHHRGGVNGEHGTNSSA